MYKSRGPPSHFLSPPPLSLSLTWWEDLKLFVKMTESVTWRWLCPLSSSFPSLLNPFQVSAPPHFSSPFLISISLPSSSHKHEIRPLFYSLFITKQLSNKSAADGRDLKMRHLFPFIQSYYYKDNFPIHFFVILSPNIAYNKGFELSRDQSGHFQS